MKKSHALIAALSILCLLVALIAFFLPTHNGMILSRFVVFLAIAVAIMCVYGVIELLFGENSAQ